MEDIKKLIGDTRRNLDMLKKEWRYDKGNEGILPISWRVLDFIEMVRDDRQYLALQLIGVPKRILREVINYIRPIISDPYWQEVYGKENYLRLFSIPAQR